MEKTIKIGEQDIKLRSSVLTIITYKSTFGSDLFNDVQKLKIDKKNGGKELTNVIQTLFQIIYALHKPFTKLSFIEFLNEFDFSNFRTWYNHVDWNGTDATGKFVADGTYKIVLESVTGKFEDIVIVDSSMRYPVESFTSCGGGIGNYGTVF